MSIMGSGILLNYSVRLLGPLNYEQGPLGVLYGFAIRTGDGMHLTCNGRKYIYICERLGRTSLIVFDTSIALTCGLMRGHPRCVYKLDIQIAPQIRE